MQKLLFVLIGTGLLSGFANGASFDCNNTKTFIENAICNNAVLSGMDDHLAILYENAKKRAGDSKEFQTIAKGNLALQGRCNNIVCLSNWYRNSIDLYSFLITIWPEDELAAYPENVKQACAGEQVSTVDIVECANAKGEFHKNQAQKVLSEINAMDIPANLKTQARELFEKGQKDANYYCGIAADVPGTIARIIGASCYLEWNQKIQGLLESRKQTWEDEME